MVNPVPAWCSKARSRRTPDKPRRWRSPACLGGPGETRPPGPWWSLQLCRTETREHENHMRRSALPCFVFYNAPLLRKRYMTNVFSNKWLKKLVFNLIVDEKWHRISAGAVCTKPEDKMLTQSSEWPDINITRAILVMALLRKSSRCCDIYTTIPLFWEGNPNIQNQQLQNHIPLSRPCYLCTLKIIIIIIKKNSDRKTCRQTGDKVALKRLDSQCQSSAISVHKERIARLSCREQGWAAWYAPAFVICRSAPEQIFSKPLTWLSIPSMSSMEKKRMAQRGDTGSWVTASG